MDHFWIIFFRHGEFICKNDSDNLRIGIGIGIGELLLLLGDKLFYI